MNPSGILFLTLRTFSAEGGIERVCRLTGKVLNELSMEQSLEEVQILSMYDPSPTSTNPYFPSSLHKGFNQQRTSFVLAAIKAAKTKRVVILSHVNLLIVGSLIQFFSPSAKVILVAHGIEVWKPLPFWKKKLLQQFTQVIAVSKFTKDKIIASQQVSPRNITVINNCLDPYLPPPVAPQTASALAIRYHLRETDIVLMTMARLGAKERHKGYDQVIQAVHALQSKYPSIKYLLIGKCSKEERQRLEQLIAALDLVNQIIFVGYISDQALAAHYSLANIFVMPSQKEGFGNVFIEALYYGKPVIAGNIDGSVDALKNGRFGILVNPNNQSQITNAIEMAIENLDHYKPKRENVLKHFGFPVYKEQWRKALVLN